MASFIRRLYRIARSTIQHLEVVNKAVRIAPKVTIGASREPLPEKLQATLSSPTFLANMLGAQHGATLDPLKDDTVLEMLWAQLLGHVHPDKPTREVAQAWSSGMWAAYMGNMGQAIGKGRFPKTPFAQGAATAAAAVVPVADQSSTCCCGAKFDEKKGVRGPHDSKKCSDEKYCTCYRPWYCGTDCTCYRLEMEAFEKSTD